MNASSFSPWRLLLLVALLVVSSSSTTHATSFTRSLQHEQEYSLYSLKPFSVHITSSSISPETQLNVASLGQTIKAVSEKFIRESIDASLKHDVGGSGLPFSKNAAAIEEVSLQVSVKRSSQRRLSGGITAELDGSAAFELLNKENEMPSRDAVEKWLEGLLEQAFSPHGELNVYEDRLMATDEPHLQTMTSMVVTTDFENRSKANVGGTVENTTTTKSPLKTTFWTLCTLLVAGFVVVVLFVRRHNQKLENTMIMTAGTMDTSTGSSPRDHDSFYGGHHDNARNLACMAEQGMHPHHDKNDEYEEPSLLQRFYQATFSTAPSTDTSMTQDSHSTTNPHIGHAIHNPRRSSYELEIEDDVVDHHIHRSGPYIEGEGGGLASWVRSTFSKNTFSTSEQEELQFMHDGPHGSKPFVYRDFPRHDGTPCLIYNSPVNSSDQGIGSLNGSTVWASSLSPKSTTSQDNELQQEEEPVDSFVDRLEQLMVVRHEQYQERCNMEWERKRRSKSSDGGIISIQQAEAALDDFLDVGGVPLVSPTESDNNNVTTTPPKRTFLSHENVLTDEKNIDAAMKEQHRRKVSWDEQDPTISGGVMS